MVNSILTDSTGDAQQTHSVAGFIKITTVKQTGACRTSTRWLSV